MCNVTGEAVLNNLATQTTMSGVTEILGTVYIEYTVPKLKRHHSGPT